MIKYPSANQVSIDDFLIPQGKRLNPGNRWVKLAQLLPWDELSAIYSKKMSQQMGRNGIHPRIIIGAVIIKHTKSLSDEQTIEEIRENPYMQYFLGLSEYTYDQVFTPSLFVSIRKRLGEAEFNIFIDKIIKTTEEAAAKDRQKKKQKTKKNDNDNDSANKGHLIVDATVAPADIKYPTDLDLLNQSREKSEWLIDLLWEQDVSGTKKPRTYRRKAKADYLSVAKIRRKSKKKLHKAIGQQLRYLRRNLHTIDKMLESKGQDSVFPLAHKHQRSYWIIQEVYRQQKEMFDNRQHSTVHRIVSISQPHVRPIVRGKAGHDVEFGIKISLSLVNGSCRLHKTSWEAYNEGGDLEAQIEAYKSAYGFYPADVSADQIYGTRENRRYMKSKGINFSGVELGRPKQLTDELKAHLKEKKKKRCERVKVEGKFGEGKRKYQLDLIMAKRSDTSVSWVGAVLFVMDIAHLLRVISLSLFGKSLFYYQIIRKNIIGIVFRYQSPYFRLGASTF